MKKRVNKQAKKASKIAKAENLKKKQLEQTPKTIHVKNAEGDPDTVAEILIQNKIDYTPKVSVVIPVYNVEPYLRQCLDSVLNQTLKEIEIICVDDGSTDASLDILKEYAAKDKRITVITQKNLYAGVARNAGLSQAKGEYVHFLDSDDLIYDNSVYKDIYSQAYNLNCPNVIRFKAKAFDTISGGYVKKEGYELRHLKEFSEKNILDINNDIKLIVQLPPTPWLGVVKLSFILENKIKFNNQKCCNDRSFFALTYLFSKKIYLADICAVKHRVNNQGSLVGIRDQYFSSHYESIRKVYNCIKKQNIPSAVASTVMTWEIRDMMNFFNKFFYTSPYSFEIYRSITSFFETFDYSICKYEIKQYPFYSVMKRLNGKKGKISKFDWWFEKEINKFSDNVFKQILNVLLHKKQNKKNIKKEININKVDVAFILDDGFVIPTATAITSLLENKDESTYYNIYLVVSDLSQNNIDKFLKYSGEKSSVNIIECSSKKYESLHNFDSSQPCCASISALLKFELPNLLNHLDKVLYLDGDILVHGDLSELFNTHLDQEYVAAVKDSGKMYYSSEITKKLDNYFNSGVMLLNLRKLREDSMPQKLFDAKKHSTDTSLMDQNVLNIVFNDKVKYLDIKYNFLYLNLVRAKNKYTIEQLNTMYSSNYSSLEDVHIKAKVIHFSSKDKPWKYSNIICSKEWFEYYKRSKFYNKDIVLQTMKKDMNDPLFDKDDNIVISLTSYPARIKTVHKTLETLLNQTVKANNIVLWLAPEQFPNKEADLPQDLLNLKDKGITIDWYKDIRSYKKIIPTLEKYPDAIIITADDDILYPMNWVEALYSMYKKAPDVIWCHRAHKMIVKNNILPYDKWKKHINNSVPSYSNFCTSGGGVLYPRKCFYSDIDKEDLYTKLCPTADDIWLWAMCILNHRKINVVPMNMKTLTLIDGTQETSLKSINVEDKRNDLQVKNIINTYPEILELLKKEHTNTFLKSYFLFPYYLIKVVFLKQKYETESIKEIIRQLRSWRLDIKNFNTIANALEIKTSDASISAPFWFSDSQGRGNVIEGNKLKNLIKVKIIKDGNLVLRFRGSDHKYEGKRFSVWTDYKSIKIDGKEIIENPIKASFEKSYTYEMSVKNGQEILIEIEQKYHAYTENELKSIILKLISANSYGYGNVDIILEKLKKYFPIIDEKTFKKQQINEYAERLLSNLMQYRIDIRNNGKKDNRLQVCGTKANITTPKWYTGSKGEGKVIQNNLYKDVMKLKMINNGLLEFYFRGKEIKLNDSRMPLWIDYKSIKIDDKEILSEPVATWHDKPFKYEMPVEDGQEVTLEIEQQYHQYSREELKDIISKLNVISAEQLTDELIDTVYQKMTPGVEDKAA